MPAPYGITATGFSAKRLEDILLEIRDDIASASELGPNINTEAESPFGQLVEIFGGGIAELWEEAERSHTVGKILKANDQTLADTVQLYGIAPEGAVKTTVDVTLHGDASTDVDAGSIVSLDDSGARFVVQSSVTIGGGGTIPAVLEAEDAGPVQVLAGSSWTIVTPITGWDSVSNAADGDTGRSEETDGELRARAFSSRVAGPGSAADAIRTEVLTVESVTQCIVIENETIDPDADGRPGKSVEVVVQDGADQAIGDAIWKAKPTSVNTVSVVSAPYQESVSVTDKNGDSKTVAFSRPEPIPVWVEIDYTPKPSFPSDIDPVTSLPEGEAIMQQAILDFEAALKIGQIVAPVDIEQAVLCAFEEPVFNVLTLRMGLTASPPTAVTVPSSRNTIAAFDSSRIDIVEV